MNRRFSIDAASDTATLSILDVPTHDDILDAGSRCAALPATVHTLRIDLTRARDIDDASADALIAIVRDWRRTRNGQVVVSGGSDELTLLVDPSLPSDHTPRASIALATMTRRGRRRDAASASAHSDAALMGIFL
jgi:hypothetical protein